MEALDDKIMDTDTRTRIVVYDFLRRVFLHEPTDEFFGRLVDSGLLEDLNGLPGIEKMRSYVQSALSSGDIDEARQDFYQLFLGPRRLKAPPWESVYRSEFRLVNQESTTEVRRLYAKFGFETEAGQLEDHFGTECDFLFRLCSLLGVIDKHGRSDLLGVQKHFVKDHLLEWVPGFAEDIMRNATTDYFRGVAEFVGYWVHNEEEYLDTVA